jgi:hypothetical protein
MTHELEYQEIANFYKSFNQQAIEANWVDK